MNQHIQLNYEQNALRYTAGYIVNALIKKLKHVAYLLKEEMMCCLIEMGGAEEKDTCPCDRGMDKESQQRRIKTNTVLPA